MIENLPATATIRDVAAMRLLDEVEKRILDRLGGERIDRAGDTSKDAPVFHHFTPGLYARELHMPKGMVITSQIHKTRHPFVVSKGSSFVYMGGSRWEKIEAPHFGITEPGTRRLLIIMEDTIWTTFHVTDKTDVYEIADDILIPYENPLLAEGRE